MDPLDRLALTESLRAYGVSATVSQQDYFVSPHPIDALIAAARPHLTKPLIVFGADVGGPEHFFLDGFDFFPVVFSARYVGLANRFYSLLWGSLATVPDLLARMFESLALETMAEFFLLARRDELAVIAFSHARFVAGANGQSIMIGDPRSLLGVGTDLWEIERNEVDELYAVNMLLGFAHELGHAIERSRLGGADGPPWCTDRLIAEVVTLFAARAPADAAQSYREHGPAAVLDIARLRSEIAADISGCRLLAQALRPMLAAHGEPGRDPDFAVLAGAIAMHFPFLEFVNTCWRAVQLAALTPDDGPKIAALLQQPIAFATRKHLLMLHLPVLGADFERADGGPADIRDDLDIEALDAETHRQSAAFWSQPVNHNEPALVLCGAGLDAALHTLQATEPEDQLISLCWFRTENANAEFERGRFLTLARSFGLNDDRLARLNGLLGGGPAVTAPPVTS